MANRPPGLRNRLRANGVLSAANHRAWVREGRDPRLHRGVAGVISAANPGTGAREGGNPRAYLGGSWLTGSKVFRVRTGCSLLPVPCLYRTKDLTSLTLFSKLSPHGLEIRILAFCLRCFSLCTPSRNTLC